MQFHPSDLQCVGQTATGVDGVTHSVQGLTDVPWSTLHEAVDRHVECHVGGHHEGSHTLRGKLTVAHHEMCIRWTWNQSNFQFKQKHKVLVQSIVWWRCSSTCSSLIKRKITWVWLRAAGDKGSFYELYVCLTNKYTRFKLVYGCSVSGVLHTEQLQMFIIFSKDFGKWRPDKKSHTYKAFIYYGKWTALI